MRTLLVIAAAVSAPLGVHAQNAVELLNKASATVRALSKSTYDFEEVQVREYSGLSNTQTERRTRLFGSGGRYRAETLPAGPLYVFDGTYRWVYNPERNEYTKGPGAPAVAPDLSEFELAGYGVKSARLLREESVELTGGPVVCHVIEAVAGRGNATQEYSPITYWIDPARNLILKMEYAITFKSPDRPSPSSTKVTSYFTKAVVGQPVDDALLRFTPPDGAVEVKQLTFGAKSALTGKNCPDFELVTLDGKSITRAALKGQTILLQFGLGTDDEMFPAELAYRALRGNGLHVVYVAPIRVNADNYSVPVAIDQRSAVAGKFGMHSGMVLIDRFGRIAYTGASSSSSYQGLAQALQDAGVW